VPDAHQQDDAHPPHVLWKILQAISPSSPYETWADSYKNRINGWCAVFLTQDLTKFGHDQAAKPATT
jgi:hypothetical protein